MHISDGSSYVCSSALKRTSQTRTCRGGGSRDLFDDANRSSEKLAASAAPTGGAGAPRHPASADPPVQQIRELVRVLLLLREDLFEDALGGGVALADVVDHLAIAVDCDALGNEIQIGRAHV